jgi:hypothetical protein
VIGVVDALRRFNERSATLELKGALLAVGAQHTLLNRRMPIAMRQKSATFFHKASGDIEEVTVTLESSAKAAPVDISTVAASVEIATMRTCRLLPELF